jgi:CubicO group peptidase (beta-lactamase class C family)
MHNSVIHNSLTRDSASRPGMSAERLAHLVSIVEADVESGLYFGAAIKIARHGKTELDTAIGFGDAAQTVSIETDSIFSIFSATKAFINVLVLRAVELGHVALTTKMVDIIPEFAGAPRDKSTIFHFLTHTTGMPGIWEPKPNTFYDVLDDAVAAICEYALGTVEPGARCDYSPMANHTLLGEVLRRTDPRGRSIHQIMAEDLFEPLGMTSTWMGIRPHLRSRHIVPEMRGIVPIKNLSQTSPGDAGLFTAESNESTWVGASSSTSDLSSFAEMLRGGGTLGDARVLSPRTVAIARQNWTGELENELYRTVALRSGYTAPPAYLGLGFQVRGEKIVHHQLGTLTSPETFGNYGAGSVVFWVDPQADVSFVCLTAGLLSQAQNIQRFQRLSDVAISATL